MKITMGNIETQIRNYKELWVFLSEVEKMLPRELMVGTKVCSHKTRLEDHKGLFAFANAVSGMYSKEDEDWRD